MHMVRGAISIKLDVEHAFRDDAPITRYREARILDRMLDIEEYARPGAVITLVHQHRAALQKIAVALEGEVNYRVEKRMTWATRPRAAAPAVYQGFSKAIRSYRGSTGSPIPISRSRLRTEAGTWVIS
jgi:hypothetical protein